MRQVFDPWMHWGHFRGGDERAALPGPPGGRQRRQGRRRRRRAGSPARGRGRGGPLRRRAGGRAARGAERRSIFSAFVADAEGLVRTQPVSSLPTIPTSRPASRPGKSCASASAPGPARPGTSCGGSRSRAGCRSPSMDPTSSDAQRRVPRSAPIGPRSCDGTRTTTRSTSPPSFLAADVGAAVGFVPRDDETRARHPARDVRSLPQRRRPTRTCAAPGSTPSHRPDRPRASATAIRRRLSLPRSSPELMPPLRVGELPRWAIARIDRYLRDRCADPGACD